MLNVAFGFGKRSCNISNVGLDFDSDMSQVLVLISVSAQRGPGSICWFRTPTNEFRLSLLWTQWFIFRLSPRKFLAWVQNFFCPKIHLNAF